MAFSPNPGMFAVSFIEISAGLILLILYSFLASSFPARFLRYWLAAWATYVVLEATLVGFRFSDGAFKPPVGYPLGFLMAALIFASVLECTGRGRYLKYIWPWVAIITSGFTVLIFRKNFLPGTRWAETLLEASLYITAGWILWRSQSRHQGIGWKLLAALLLLRGLNDFDRPDWPSQTLVLFRYSLHGLFAIAAGIAMAVLVLEAGRARNEDLNEKLRRLALITAEATQSFRVDQALAGILHHLVENLGASHGLVFLVDDSLEPATLVLRASVGFGKRHLKEQARVPLSEPWATRVFQQEAPYVPDQAADDTTVRKWMDSENLRSVALVRVPGKEGPLGLLGIGSVAGRAFEPDEQHFLVNVANLLGLTVQNVALFESAAESRRQWRDTFDSIDDLIFVHSAEGRILRTNVAFAERIRIEPAALVGRLVRDVFARSSLQWVRCPYCEGAAGKPEETDPFFGGYFLATDSVLHGTEGGRFGTIHVLKDFTSRRVAESKFRNLFEKAQEGVFISTPEGNLIDFNDAFMRIYGYQTHEELLENDLHSKINVDPNDRRRLKRLLDEFGEVSDFEFQFRRRDGEIRTAQQSAFVTRDETGAVVAYQGFVLDITERKQAEMEIRRRNHELMALNAIGELLRQSSTLDEGLTGTLRNIKALFEADAAAVYFLDEPTRMLKPSVAVGYQSLRARDIAPFEVSETLLQQIRQVHATLLSGSAPALPDAFRELQRAEGIESSQVVVLWTRERIMGTLLLGCRGMREFSAAELNLLAAVGNQIATTIDKSLLLEETREAYETLRRTQEQLLQSEKMAAVGQLISGVAHELNNPLTAILGYSQLLQSGEYVNSRGADYLGKLYKQAQRTHHIVQSLLSFARQHKPERAPVQLNQILEDTLILREYDLKLANIQLHREFDRGLPLTGGDFHQLQQVFLNILNNAVDAVNENGSSGDIWIRTVQSGDQLLVEFTDSGPGVQNPNRIFDPFYTTKPVGKGTGLGLSIAYGIVKEHGGEIAVRNSPSRGAVFTVILPLSPVSELSQIEKPSREAENAAGKVLLIDDEEAVLKLEQEILSSRGISVRTARSPWEAIDILKNELVDAAVIDVKMPGEISTASLFRWIEQNHPDLSGRIVFTSSNVHEAAEKNLPPRSSNPLLTKPFGVEDFWKAVQKVLAAEAPTPR